MRETKSAELPLRETIRLLAERPRFRVRRTAVWQHLPVDVVTVDDLAAFFGISRATAWRLFCAPEVGNGFRRASAESAAAVCAAFPGVPEAELIELVSR